MQQQRYPNNQLATSVIANTKNKTIDKFLVWLIVEFIHTETYFNQFLRIHFGVKCAVKCNKDINKMVFSVMLKY